MKKTIKIRKTGLGDIPRIAVSVSDMACSGLVQDPPIDILEIRVDKFRKLDPEYVRGVIARIKKSGIPLIMTIRSIDEGGKKNIPDELKLSIFKKAISLVDAVDIELRSPIIAEVVKMARIHKKTIIVSWHDFRSTPGNRVLTGILKDAVKKGAQVIKIAVKAKDIGDVIRLMRFTSENKAKNLITISLGTVGSISRLLFPMAGSLITYAYINKPSGPGQFPLSETQKHFRTFYPKYGRTK